MDDDARAYSMLKVSTQDHQMKIIRDEGLYRHIRFQEPGTSIWHWDLVTWPGHLVITGDLQDYHFARIRDMFDFFRGPAGHINPSYWSEKLCGHHQTYEKYSPEKFKQLVYEHFRYWCETAEEPHTPLWKAICEELFDEYTICDASLAREALGRFRFYFPEHEMVPVSADARERDFVPQYLPRHRSTTWHSNNYYEFVDAWEWNFQEYDYHFLLSLHAIVWGINRYDALRRRSPWVSYEKWEGDDDAEEGRDDGARSAGGRQDVVSRLRRLANPNPA